MNQRGHPWPEPGRHPHKAKDKEDCHRYSHQDWGQNYPSPDPRGRDRRWAHPGAHFTSPPASAEQYSYSPHQYHNGYGHGYDYITHNGQWDYGENYGYYNYDYYRGQHRQHDAGRWVPHDSWSPEHYHERPSKQEHSGSSFTEDYRYNQGRDSSQSYLKDREDNPSRENEEISSYYLGTLESSKHSGLSSSSYELSQYINGSEPSDPVPQLVHSHVAETLAPLKYSIPHAVVSFGPAGQLLRVTPGFSTQENTSMLEIHSLEVILSETQEQQELRKFPGPLTREGLHKVDAIEFAYQMTGACMTDEKLPDKSSAALLWNLLILLCRQNAQIVGSDIAELLTQGSQSNGSWESEAPTLIDLSESAAAEAPPCRGDDLLTGNCSSFTLRNSDKALQSYTQLLLAGRKKEALESAMSNSLWGHAFFLASKMDNRSYTTVLNRFTGQLTSSDPLQTLFQLLSGRIPAMATCCGNEKWGDWRPHLAVMLSNETGDPAVQKKAVVTMGDTLASRGLVHAAHVCYLTANVPFGVFSHKAERMVLVGSNHRRSFQHFATNSAIQCTELYEYCQTLGGKCFSIAPFQVYKFLYACRLLDCGLASQAFHYCEVVGQTILRQTEPCFILTAELIKLADRLRCSEGQFSEAEVEPDWLKLLRARQHSVQMGESDYTATYQTLPEAGAMGPKGSKVYLGSDWDDLSPDILSPEHELLHYKGTEDHENLLDQAERSAEEMMGLAQNSSGAQDWPNPPLPVTGVYVPLGVVTSHNFTYCNADSANVSIPPERPSNHLPSAAEGLGSSPEALVMGHQMLDVDLSHQGQKHQNVPKVLDAPEQTAEPPKQSTKTGWFSGWFKSKPKDVQKDSSEQGGSTHTDAPPAAGFGVPPPPTIVSPGMFPTQASSPGINPFSRNAGQQLG
ncbi:protein transport protein Sec16B [Betta splendens]|uniref:Protein transport protein Sec16B n=1 Tax=Betta splendens TaxID=158456 RepID=A0A6P7M9G4_BETSP|nr:protein transport protein Sec16B [Betta splendens]XP_029002959.1 protein transport protein Sec16B [Betta splendens]XP_029002960.1 protein transport protein Sec16B [Betta splendens]XP_029002962.1 protein transport protein Sec16B [Betta splendens]XP_029002963.1 protein transport protein Sec16B [Betta splendens]XP_029002964.1 protein transport protein Sec16B [Betta splendens]XP_040926335.1 protein transport protein Sec16B [Betta splendens]XP_055364282.1 protein transport protein Sec16B [Bett